MEDMKVLFHISDTESWNKALKNIENLLKDVDEKSAIIQVVANASAVLSYYNGGPELLGQMKALSGKNVNFLACRNALEANALDEKMLPSFVRGVPGGITEIVTRQRQGYAYIKP